jgi:hypothetical protein
MEEPGSVPPTYRGGGLDLHCSIPWHCWPRSRLSAEPRVRTHLALMTQQGCLISTLTCKMYGSLPKVRTEEGRGANVVRPPNLAAPMLLFWACNKLLTWAFSRAEDGIRTRDAHLGKVAVFVVAVWSRPTTCCSVHTVSATSSRSVVVVERSTIPCLHWIARSPVHMAALSRRIARTRGSMDDPRSEG